MTVASQILLTEFRGSLPSYVDEELAMPSVSGSSTLRGVADQAAGTALLAITSIVNWEQHVTLRCLSETYEHKPVTITIAPYATSLVSNCAGQVVNDLESYQQSLAQHKEEGIQGYELVTDGGPAGISAFGLAPHLRNQDVIFSAIPFTDPEEIHSANSAFTGVPFGSQDALPDGVYKPRISFTNFAATPAHVKVSIAATQPGDLPVTGRDLEGTVLRLVNYQVYNVDKSAVASIPIAEVFTTSGWSCTNASQPATQTTACNGGTLTEAIGQFQDLWSDYSTAYTPANCGVNVTDHWQ